jgi:NitT/TauT family transport system substrate-binding protein
MARMFAVSIAFALLLPVSALAASEPIAFGTLPALQALPLYVAQEQGFFAAEGVAVELVPFRSGLEKDAALAAGRIQGYFGDMLTSIVFAANFKPAKMVATVYNSTGRERMFAVLAAPGTGNPGLEKLALKGIAGSSNTVIEYVTRRLLDMKTGSAMHELKMIESKDIAVRLPMLLQGQVAGAVLPEPLATLAERKGAVAVADDRGTGLSPTVLLFTDDFLSKRPEDARRFLRAVARASAYISNYPKAVRPSMVSLARIPEELAADYPMPLFPPPSVPDELLVADAQRFLAGKKVLKSELAYEQMVAPGFLK